MSGGPKWLKPVQAPNHIVNVVCDGDSFTLGTSGGASSTQTYPYYLGQQAGSQYGGSGASIANLGVGGNTIQNMISRGAATDAYYSTGYRQNILLWLAGYNNYGDISLLAQTLSYSRQYIAARVAAGWTVGWFTLTDFTIRTEPAFDTARRAHNTIMRAQYANYGAAGILDVGADAAMGATGAGSPLFLPVTGHPTAAGNQVLANYAQAFLQRMAVYL